MSTDRDVTRIVRSWLEEGVSALPDRVLDTVLDQLPATPQRRALWPVRRFGEMNNFAKFAVSAAAVVVVAIVGINLLPKAGGVGGPGPSQTPGLSSLPTAASTPIPSPSPSGALTEFPEGPLPAGTYTLAPFTAAGEGMCHQPPQPGCAETPADDSIRFTMTVPDGWNAGGPWVLFEDNQPPSGAGIAFIRGAWLLTDPCKFGSPWIPVGPTVADFVDAVAKHPILDTTAPVDVELAGYSGKYFELQAPADISNCDNEPGGPPQYRPWEPGIYAQGPGHRWHQWVLDVHGIRVVVQSFDYPRTSATRRAELQAIVDSIQIQP
jgi:hypothetical protein